MPGKKPKFIIVYRCDVCGIESGYTELDKPWCRYCEKRTLLKTVVSQEKLTIEAIARRMAASADNMMKALQGAHSAMPEELKRNATKDNDPEKDLLNAMAKAKSLRENIHNLKLKKKKSKKR